MKSGLEGRNNEATIMEAWWNWFAVSMKSGLEGRNNAWTAGKLAVQTVVSMKSGLEGRNN